MAEKFLNLSGLNTLWSKLKKFNVFCNVHSTNNGKQGWLKLCSITCSKTYINTPIALKIIPRGYSTSTLEFMIENATTTTPKLLYAKHLIKSFNGNTGKTSNVGYTYEDVEGVRTFHFWKKKNEGWGSIHVQADSYLTFIKDNLLVIHDNVFSETEPEGIVYADEIIEATVEQVNTKADASHKHTASDITSGTFGTSRIADGAITPEKINVISLIYKRAENGGRNWHRIFKVILPTDRTTVESRHSKAYRVFDLYIDGYQNKGKYSYLGRLGINFSIATGMTIADYNFLTHGYARAKWVLGRPSESAYDCKIVKTESTIEFFILSNDWDTNLAVVCEKKYDGRFGDGEYDSTIVRNAYTIEEFETYCSDKVVVNSELDNIKIGWAEKADTATSADSATKATQDGSGNNIVDTYATKTALSEEAAARSEADATLQSAINAKASIESVTSLGQQVQGLTTGLNGKLNNDGSNANSTTTYNVLNAAAGGASIDITDDEEIILTYPTGNIAYKRTLAKFAEWIETKVMPIINRKLNAWLGNEQEVVFNNVKVRKGVSSSEVEVATYYGISQSYYDKTYIDETIGNIDSNVTRYNGTSSIDYSYVGLPIVCKPTVYSSATSQTADNWIRQCVPSRLITHGRIFIFVNPSSVNYTITDLANGSYSLGAGNTLTIVYHNGTYYKASDKT